MNRVWRSCGESSITKKAGSFAAKKEVRVEEGAKKGLCNAPLNKFRKNPPIFSRLGIN